MTRLDRNTSEDKVVFKEMTSLSVGSTEAQSVYCGSTLVWRGKPPANIIYDNTGTAHNDVDVVDDGSYTFNGAYSYNTGVTGELNFRSLDKVMNGNFLYYGFYLCTSLTSISFPSLTTISGNSGCRFMFDSCTSLTSISFPNLTTISGSSGCSGMFQGCISLTSISFPNLTTIGGNYGCQTMFQACTSLTSISFPSLATISGSSGCSNMFYGCTSITSASFPNLTTISGNSGCSYMFRSCSNIEHIYFNALTTSSFESYTNQFSNMMSNTGTTKTHTIHFPSNLQSTISGLSGYPLFGGSSGYVVLAFDLPATS